MDESGVDLWRFTDEIQTLIYANQELQQLKGRQLIDALLSKNIASLNRLENNYFIDIDIQTDKDNTPWVVVLLCTQDMKFAILERAGCKTTKSHISHWKDGYKPCRFYIDVREACN
jgi:hypothetical protein